MGKGTPLAGDRAAWDAENYPDKHANGINTALHWTKAFLDTLYAAIGHTHKLDDLAAPDDNTNLDASTTKHGLMPKFPGGTDFLRADKTWTTPAGGGDVVGPASATDGHLAVFDGATGKVIKDGGAPGGGGGYTQGARVYNNANITISTASDTALTFNSERYDADTIHDTGSNTSRLTCKTAGKYIIVGHVEFASNATGARQVFIRLNGTTDIGRQAYLSPGSATRFCITTIYDLALNDYIELVVWQNSGGNLDVVAAGNRSPEFSMQRIG